MVSAAHAAAQETIRMAHVLLKMEALKQKPVRPSVDLEAIKKREVDGCVVMWDLPRQLLCQAH